MLIKGRLLISKNKNNKTTTKKNLGDDLMNIPSHSKWVNQIFSPTCGLIELLPRPLRGGENPSVLLCTSFKGEMLSNSNRTATVAPSTLTSLSAAIVNKAAEASHFIHN